MIGEGAKVVVVVMIVNGWVNVTHKERKE